MKLRKDYEISLLIIGCIFVNYIGKALAVALELPVWFDSVGTVFSAYVFGTVCGAVVGVTVNILYSYGLVNIGVGAIALSEGSTGNVWGDKVARLLMELRVDEIFSFIAGEVYLDFLDKVLTMLLLFAVIRIFRRKGRAKKVFLGILLMMLHARIFLGDTDTVYAAESAENYMGTTDSLVIFTLSGGLNVCDTVSEIRSAVMVYTYLLSGEDKFHLAVLDDREGSVIAKNTYRITREKEIYNKRWFRLCAIIVVAIIISYLTWLFVKTQIRRTLRIQKMELEWAKNQLKMGNEMILTIAQAVDAKDGNTRQHSVRVSEYSVLIAKKLGYSDEACEELRKIALLHDIGKIGIPDRVLNKPTRLTDEEYEIMKSHVTLGAEILKNFTLIDHVADGALYHHERYDGRGYVHGLKGEEIPLNVRIIGIADAFDAMTANRVYRKKLDFEYVLEEIKKGSGTQFDPQLVKIMIGLIEEGTIDVNRIYGTESREKV